MGLGPVPIPARGVRHSGAGDVGVSARGPVGIRFGAGPCRPARSVTRREKPGQTRSPSRLCRLPDGLPAGPGGQHLYCPSCDPTTHVRVSLRDRRDTRPHPHHLLCHPDVRRPAVQGPAAVDGAHAGARPVRPGRQADAPLRHLQARRHRRLHAPARLGRARTARRSSSASSGSAATPSTSTTAASSSTAPRSTSRTCSRPSPAIPPNRRASPATSTSGSSRPARCS